MLQYVGYKATFIFDLTLCSVGTLLFWLAVIKRTSSAFYGATFDIGSWLGTLETAVNPYLAGTIHFSYLQSRWIDVNSSISVVGPQGIPNFILILLKHPRWLEQVGFPLLLLP